MPNHKHPPSREGEALPAGPETTNHKTRHQHILDLLMAADGAEVPLAEIMVCAAQYNACIHGLRKRGFKIVNRNETRNGVKHSWYRLESSPAEPMPGSPSHKRTSRDRRSPNQPAPPSVQPAGLPLQPSLPAQTLSLFPEMPAAAPQPVWRDPELGGVKNKSVKNGSVKHG